MLGKEGTKKENAKREEKQFSSRYISETKKHTREKKDQLCTFLILHISLFWEGRKEGKREDLRKGKENVRKEDLEEKVMNRKNKGRIGEKKGKTEMIFLSKFTLYTLGRKEGSKEGRSDSHNRTFISDSFSINISNSISNGFLR